MAGRSSRETSASRRNELKNAKVEPICRKYLDLRYRLMPYLYTAVRECHDTGMPIMRALLATRARRAGGGGPRRRIHVGPGHARRTRRREERDLAARLSAARKLVRFWTNEKLDGGREIDRPVDLETTPIFVRAGSVLPMGPVKQYADEPSDAPLGTHRLSRRKRIVVRVRRRRPHVRLSTGRVDADRDELAGRHAAALAQPRAGARMLAPMRRTLNVRVAASQRRRRWCSAGRRLWCRC